MLTLRVGRPRPTAAGVAQAGCSTEAFNTDGHIFACRWHACDDIVLLVYCFIAADEEQALEMIFLPV